MKLHQLLFLLIAVTVCLTGTASAQTSKLYQQMSTEERSAFISAQARRVAQEISGRPYEFTPAFEGNIRDAVDRYIRRLNSDGRKTDLRVVLQRGQSHAPVLGGSFRARNLSPLIGLYIPFIESEYVNIQSPNSMGAIGMFQFLPKTGERYGLSREELLDINKSADAAARYITDGMKRFEGDPMKEALALLSYNRGGNQVVNDLSLIGDGDKTCSICALTAGRDKLDATFRDESVYYVPLFFAAAIIGENPQAFGLGNQPLSSY